MPTRNKKRPLRRLFLFTLPTILLLLYSNLLLIRSLDKLSPDTSWKALYFSPSRFSRRPPTRAPQLLKNFWRDETETTIHHTFDPRPGISEEYSIQYQNFALPIPHFVSKHEEDQFLLTDYHLWQKLPEVARRGTISVVPNGRYDRSDDCGYRANYSKHLPTQLNTNESVHNETVLALADIPAQKFQHFMDSGVPKLVQATLYLQDHPNASIASMFNNTRTKMMDQILRKMGFTNPTQFRPLSQLRGHVKELVLVCQAPPIHPALWQKFRELLGIHNLTKGQTVVYVKRTPQNSLIGRIVLNDHEVQKFLQQRYGKERLVTFDSNKYPDLESTMKLFGNASIILGMHGGGLYNTMFAPSDATLVEVMPVTANGLPFGSAHEIFWLISSTLGQQFWRLTTPMKGTSTNVAINLTQLAQALDVIDAALVSKR